MGVMDEEFMTGEAFKRHASYANLNGGTNRAPTMDTVGSLYDNKRPFNSQKDLLIRHGSQAGLITRSMSSRVDVFGPGPRMTLDRRKQAVPSGQYGAVT